MKVTLLLLVQRGCVGADIGHDQSVSSGGDRLLETWDLTQLLHLNALHDTLLCRQGCNVFLLTATPQNFNACNRGEDFFVLRGRIKDK